jgi:hypothetical protein
MGFPTMSASDNKVLRKRSLLLRRAPNSAGVTLRDQTLVLNGKKSRLARSVGAGGALTGGRLGASSEAVDRFHSRCSVCQNRFRPMVRLRPLQQAICPPKQPFRPASPKDCARPDRGCPGGSIRSMQGGWGAQHRSDIGNVPLPRSSSGDRSRPTLVLRASGKVQRFFENVDLMPGIAHFPRNSRQLGVKKPMLWRKDGSLPDTTGKVLQEENSRWRRQIRSSSPAR